MLAALASEQPSGAAPYRVKSYSIAGNTKILEGSLAAPDIVGEDGPVRLTRYESVAADLEELTQFESASIFGETYSQIVGKAVNGAENLQTFLNAHWDQAGWRAKKLHVDGQARRRTVKALKTFLNAHTAQAAPAPAP